MFIRILSLLVIMVFAASASSGEVGFQKKQLQVLTANGKLAFTVEIADSNEKHQHGLMFRKNMPTNNGMLFLFDKPQVVSMWMKDTYIPLDILFIKNGGLIYKIVQGKPLSLESIASEEDIIAVLELNGGICKKLGIRENDKIVFEGLK